MKQSDDEYHAKTCTTQMHASHSKDDVNTDAANYAADL